MSEKPALDEWRRLFQAAVRLKEIAPWEWMEETEVFGVQDPETGELGFVSVMGVLGEHLALAVYLGPMALYRFWEVHREDSAAPPDSVLELLQLQVSYEDRQNLTDQDRQLIKDLGLKFRGRQAWPQFRSFRPGFCPWYLEPQEIRFLTHALEQSIDVILRLREQPDLLVPSHDESYLVRTARREGDELVWADTVMDVPPPEPTSITIVIPSGQLAQAKRLPKSRLRLEVDVSPMLSGTIAEKPGQRPYFPYIFLCLDGEAGMVLDIQVLQPTPSLDEMYSSIPALLVRQFITMKKLPAQIDVARPVLYQMLQPLCEELNIGLKWAPSLPALQSARQFILERF